MKLPEDYVISKFYEYGYRAKRHNSGAYCCACPICREGKSYHRKRRCWYLPKRNQIHCFNCGWTSKPEKWIITVSKCSYSDILKELEDGDYDYGIEVEKKEEKEIVVPDIPVDSVDLFDESQVAFYNNKHIDDVVSFIKRRRLASAVNRCKTFYFSLQDKIHRYRLIIPFYESGEVVFYQSRKVFPFDKKEKYISKLNGNRSIFNFDNIKDNIEDVFIFEGPIDSMFVKNGVAVGGITKSEVEFTEKQKEQMRTLWMYNQIWVLDSQWVDKTALIKTEKLLLSNKNVFIWPENHGTVYKDFNEMCVALDLNEISMDYIKKHTFKGDEGVLQINKIKELIRT